MNAPDDKDEAARRFFEAIEEATAVALVEQPSSLMKRSVMDDEERRMKDYTEMNLLGWLEERALTGYEDHGLDVFDLIREEMEEHDVDLVEAIIRVKLRSEPKPQEELDEVLLVDAEVDQVSRYGTFRDNEDRFNLLFGLRSQGAVGRTILRKDGVTDREAEEVMTAHGEGRLRVQVVMKLPEEKS